MQRMLKNAPGIIRPCPVSPPTAPRVLLLTSTLGSGHLRAAQAVQAALLERCPAARVQILDFWSLTDGHVAQTIRQSYLRFTQQYPELYDRVYQLEQTAWRRVLQSEELALPELTEALASLVDASSARKPSPGAEFGRHAMDRVLLRLLHRLLKQRSRAKAADGKLLGALIKWSWLELVRRLDSRVRAFGPDVVVSTQMMPAALFSVIKNRSRLSIPAFAVVTDFGIHDFWIQPGIDCYCVGHESIAGLRDLDARASRILPTGIPLLPAFSRPPGRRTARKRLRIDPDAPAVLVLGGGLGLGVDVMTGRLLRCFDDVQVLAVAGHGTAAGELLARLLAEYPERLRVWNWTEEMAVLMRAADVVVGKPGGLTLAEALACGRPLLGARSLGGQEGFNTRFLERHRVGALVPEDMLARTVESLLANRRKLAQIQHRAWMLGRREASARIAEAVLLAAQTADHAESLHAR